jgi:hypothetical protein
VHATSALHRGVSQARSSWVQVPRPRAHRLVRWTNMSIMVSMSLCDRPSCGWTGAGSVASCPRCFGPVTAVRYDQELKQKALSAQSVDAVGKIHAKRAALLEAHRDCREAKLHQQKMLAAVAAAERWHFPNSTQVFGGPPEADRGRPPRGQCHADPAAARARDRRLGGGVSDG